MAKTAQASRQLKSKQQVQKGRIVYANEACHIAHQQKMDDLVKAQALVAKTAEKKEQDKKKERHRHLVEIHKAGKAQVKARQEYAWWDGDYYQR